MIKILSTKILLLSMKQSCIRDINERKPKNFFLYLSTLDSRERKPRLEDNERMRGVRMAEKYKSRDREILREHGHAPGSMRIPGWKEARKWVDENFR